MNEQENNQFSNLKGLDLKELLSKLNNTFLTYRPGLNLDENITYGTEIEYEVDPRKKDEKCELIKNYISTHYSNWSSINEPSIESGGEITSPILTDCKNDWQELKNICEFLRSQQVIIDSKAGGHIHIGAQIFNYDYNYLRKFIKLYTVYERVIYRFMYGDKINGRKDILDFASPIAENIKNKLNYINKDTMYSSLYTHLPLFKNQGLNFVHLRRGDDDFPVNTIEFRMPNATDKEVIWQNNINTAAKLMINSKNVDEDYLDYQIRNMRIYDKTKFYFYGEIYLDDALKLCDTIFDNNLDKLYFLKQYLKDFKTTKEYLKQVPAKQFVL